MSDRRVTVVGAGTMGAGIAQVAAVKGCRVALTDVDGSRLQAALKAVSARLARQVDKDRMAPKDAEASLNRITPSPRLADATRDTHVVIEAVSERMDVKLSVFRELDRYAPGEAILASNTSSISITALGSATSRPGSVVGMHFMNPVPVMKLVEVVRGLDTSDATARRVMGFAGDLGKVAVEVNDYPGFVSNRVLMPMINEAVFALMEGVAEASAIDDVMRLGMNHPLGPLALADLIGLDVCLDILTVLHSEIGDDRYRPCPLLRRHVEAGWLGRKAGRGFHRYEQGAS